MVMDVDGCNATSERGSYFRNSGCCWGPLWCYSEDVAPDIIPEDNLGYSNDGWGLDAEGSEKLAQRLTEELVSRRTIECEIAWTMAMDEMPDEVCKYCGGTGERVLEDGPRKCNGCDGKGLCRPFVTSYEFSAENVRDFRDFLRDCGGFEIW